LNVHAGYYGNNRARLSGDIDVKNVPEKKLKNVKKRKKVTKIKKSL